MKKEAKLKRTEYGIVPEGDGWYVVNAAQSRWKKNEVFGKWCRFEGDQPFQQNGINIHILEPGQPNCLYHAEKDQEDFLVLLGECILIIEGQERKLRAWDFVHCPPDTEHVFIGAGEAPCAIFMIGGRSRKGVFYPENELAQKYNAGVKKKTSYPQDAYKNYPISVDCTVEWPIS